MNMYARDLSLFDFPFSDHLIDSLSGPSPLSFSIPAEPSDYQPMPRRSPPTHRHDGTSPLPLGMDWSLPPRKWEGRDTIWPHAPHTGWSYCVTVPSWVVLPKASGSDSVVLFRVQVGIQSPEGITTTRIILRRFNEFLKLLSELKKTFPLKSLPPAPPKRLMRTKTRALLEERRRSLDEWMEKLLSDISISRSAPVAIFLELEAAARSSFDDVNQISNATSSAFQFQPKSDVTVLAATNSSVASDFGYDSFSEKSEIETPRFDRDSDGPIEANVKHGMFDNHRGLVIGDSLLENKERLPIHNWQIKGGNSEAAKRISKAEAPHGDEFEILSETGSDKLAGHIQTLSAESIGSDRPSEITTFGMANFAGDGSHDHIEGLEVRAVDNLSNLRVEFPNDLVVALTSDERPKMSRVLSTMQHRLATIKTDMEDLIARLHQELAVRQCLTTKVKDLEVELETTRQNCKDNMQQAILIERERFTQMQWDMEELRKKCLEMELKLKAEQEEKSEAESTKISLIQENQSLLLELEGTRRQLVNLQRNHEEFETKSKADVKLLVKEVKSLRSSQTELKQELARVLKEKIEVERGLQKEKKRRELGDAANAKLLHECEILHKRLLECSVNFHIMEEDKLVVDASSPSDAVDLLTTSDNRIGLLLAEAQLLAQDVESSMAEVYGDGVGDTTDDQLRKMLTDVFIDNATLRKQVNSVIRCTLSATASTENDDEDEDDSDEEVPLRKTVLSKFLEK